MYKSAIKQVNVFLIAMGVLLVIGVIMMISLNCYGEQAEECSANTTSETPTVKAQISRIEVGDDYVSIYFDDGYTERYKEGQNE